MSKTSEQKLLKNVQEELTTFLKSGKINEKELAESLSFEDLDIKDFERLKEIHFVLSDPVTEFMEQLPEWIRRIKTESYREKKTSRGEIKGRIDWGETYKARYSQNYKDKSVFVTQNPDIEYNIPENLVLKKVLGIIYRVITKEVEQIEHDWRKNFWEDGDIEELRQIFQKNVNIDRIKDMRDTELDSKQLNAARNSRREVYRQAYDLYQKYEKIMDNEFSSEEIRDLLEHTLIVPNNRPKLFELFSTFRIIRNLETEDDLQLRTISSKNDEIAVMESDEEEILIYHDSTGNLEFRQEIPDEPEDKFVKKTKQIIEQHKAGLDELIGRGTNKGLYSGRPDIVIEKYNTSQEKELKEVIIGEIKYTDRESTFSSGLRELLEYMKFGKNNNRDIEDIDLKGYVIADNLEFKSNEYEDAKIVALNTEMLIEDRFEV